MHIYDYFAELFVGEMFQTKIVEKIKNAFYAQ